MQELCGKRVLVLGLGKSGVAAARACSRAGARVTVADAKPRAELSDALALLEGLPLELAFGPHAERLFDDAECIVASPGVSADLPGIARARARGVPVIGEMELAVRELHHRIIAVTGTNGKTTTTALIGHLLSASGITACVAGNIGTALLDVLGEASEAEWVVLEVSSFQIETTPSLAPAIAIVLNVTPDHLDRHASFEAYVACKAELIRRVPPEGWGIANAADEHVAAAVAGARCRSLPFDATGRVFGRGASEPRAWFGEGDLWVSPRGNGRHRYPLAGVQLEGMHNRENMLAALAAAELAGADPIRLSAALESFRGLPHRVQLVAEYRGVRFYDDSKGTNIGATMRAVEGFAEPIVLIAGGLSKGVDFRPLAAHLRGRVKQAVLIGQAAPELESILAGVVGTVRASSMDEAVGKAVEVAQPGDIVLLSPACASFDMFRDYADRGNAFARAVKRLAGGEKA